MGRLLPSRNVAGGLRALALLVLLGAPLTLGAVTGNAPELANAAAQTTSNRTGDLGYTLYPSGTPTIDCDDLEQRYRNPGACLTLTSPAPSSASKSSTEDRPRTKPSTPRSSLRSTSQPKPSPDRDSDDENCDKDEGCLPNPTSTKPGSGSGKPHKPKPAEPADECGITDPIACVTEGIDALFRGIVESALNPLLKFLSDTLLTTPTLDDLPQVGPLWDNSWQIALACYTTLILVGGIIVMGHETLQTSYSVKEIAPRLVVGFLAGFLSLFFADQMIKLANGLSGALLGGGLDASSAGKALRDMVMGAITGGGLFLLLMGLALAIMLVALLITYVVRVAFTVILLIGAPLALMFHALPQTEGIARWWWKALAGVLAIQVAQSLTLIVALKVFFAPSGWTPFGPKPSGLLNLLVALALIYVLLKIPFWIMSSMRVGGSSRSFVGSMAKGFLAYKTLGLLKGTGGAAGGATATRPATATRSSGGGASTRVPSGGPRATGPGRAGREPSGGPSRVPPPRPPTPPRQKPTGPYQPMPSTPAPPIEDTDWGRGRTAHDTRGAHEPSGPARGSREPRRHGSPPPMPVSPRRHDRVRRAHDAAHNAWRPLANTPRPGTASPTGAALAPPIGSTPAGHGQPASSTPPPVPPGRRAQPAPATSAGQPGRAAERASDRFAHRPPPQTPISRPQPGRRVPLDLPGSHNPTPVKPARPPRPPRPQRPQQRRPGGSS